MDTFHEGFSKIRLSTAQPFLTLTERLLTFSKSSIELLEYAPQVHISINKEKKEFLVEACSPDRFSIPFVKDNAGTKQTLVRWGGRELMEPIREMIGIQKVTEPIRIWGEFFPEHNAIVFDQTDTQTAVRNSDLSWSAD